MKNNFTFSNQIIVWHYNIKQARFPWQLDKTMYKIWLSEIMLQQTQVSTVIIYYQKFIKKFPTISHLASASLNEILHIWSGLGYYKRAINLHKTANIIVKNYNNKFPEDFNTILTLPGIGRSTAGAILSLGLNKRYPILDGNIKRILLRYYSFDKKITKQSQINNKLWYLIEQLLPNMNISIFNQAMMDLGRLICTYKKPQCTVCPINNNCQSFLTKKMNQYSQKKTIQKKHKRTVWWILLFVQNQQTIWLVKRSKETIWKELFCFPEFHDFHELKTWLQKNNLCNSNNHLTRNITTVQHNISNITLTIQSVLLNINKIINFPSTKGIWYNLSDPPSVGIPSPVSTILSNLTT